MYPLKTIYLTAKIFIVVTAALITGTILCELIFKPLWYTIKY